MSRGFGLLNKTVQDTIYAICVLNFSHVTRKTTDDFKNTIGYMLLRKIASIRARRVYWAMRKVPEMIAFRPIPFHIKLHTFMNASEAIHVHPSSHYRFVWRFTRPGPKY